MEQGMGAIIATIANKEQHESQQSNNHTVENETTHETSKPSEQLELGLREIFQRKCAERVRRKRIKITKEKQQGWQQAIDHTVDNKTTHPKTKPSGQQESGIREEFNTMGVFEFLFSLGHNDTNSANSSDHEFL
jgi:hypothetical protein